MSSIYHRHNRSGKPKSTILSLTLSDLVMSYPFRLALSDLHLHYGLRALLSGCSPPPLTGTQLPAHYQLNDLIGCMSAYFMGSWFSGSHVVGQLDRESKGGTRFPWRVSMGHLEACCRTEATTRPEVASHQTGFSQSPAYLGPMKFLICALALPLFIGTAMAGTKTQSIVLGGGCFWCLDATYQLVPGVKSVVSGYAGGHSVRPSYEEVCTG